jgi:hypothetical protein
MGSRIRVQDPCYASFSGMSLTQFIVRILVLAGNPRELVASMLWKTLADLVLLIHFIFIVFIVFGGFFAMWWRWIPWVHLPAALWGAALEFGGWICPLTPLENRLRRTGGEAGYTGGFIEQYLLSIIYPSGLTREIQFILGVFVILVNLVAYGVVWWRRSTRR